MGNGLLQLHIEGLAFFQRFLAAQNVSLVSWVRQAKALPPESLLRRGPPIGDLPSWVDAA
jgi:hypothetical protein